MSQKNKIKILIAKYLPLSLAVVLLLIILLPEKAHAEPVYQVLKDNTGIGLSTRLIWKNVKDLVNYLVVAVLIAVAFAQILHVNVNTYGIKKVLPALVLAVIGANLSFFVCRLLVDVGNVVLTLFLNPSVSIVSSSTTPGTTLADAFRPMTRGEFQDLAKPANWSPTILFVKSLMMLVGAVMLYILAFLLFIRNWMIYFLIVLGPLAFMATVLPQTKALFTQWWNQFLKWTFMPIVSIFWLWLGAKWSNTAIVAGISDTGEGLTSGWFMKSVFALVCFYLAIATPMKMGGPIMQQWAGLGKKGVKKTGGFAKKRMQPKIDELKDRANRWYLHQASRGAPTADKPKVGVRDFIMGQSVGRYVRRNLRNKTFREKLKEGVGTAENSAIREAWGGKEIPVYDKDGNLVKFIDANGFERVATKPRFMSRGKQEKMGQFIDSVNSDSGEKEWMMVHLDNLFHRTPAGREATGRSHAYGERLGAAESEQKANKAEMEGIANKNQQNERNEYRDNPNYGREWSSMQELGRMEEERLNELVKIVADKHKNDAQDENQVNAVRLDHLRKAWVDVNKALEETESSLESLIPNLKNLSETERKREVDRLAEENHPQALEHIRLLRERSNVEKAWDMQSKSLMKSVDPKTKKLFGSLPWLKSMLDGAEVMGADGKVASFDITKVKSLNASLRIPKELEHMAEDRAIKLESRLAQKELASTREKRDGQESDFEFWDSSTYSEDERVAYLKGGIHALGMNGHKHRKLRSEHAHATVEAKSAGNPEFLAHQIQMARAYDLASTRAKKEDNIDEYNQISGGRQEILLDALQEGAEAEVMAIESEEIKKRIAAETKSVKDAENRELNSDEIAQVQRDAAIFIKQNPEIIRDRVQASLINTFGLDRTEVEKFVKHDVDRSTGKIKVGFSEASLDPTSDAYVDKHAAFLKGLSVDMARAQSRETEKMRYTRAFGNSDRRHSPVSREMGKDDEKALARVKLSR